MERSGTTIAKRFSSKKHIVIARNRARVVESTLGAFSMIGLAVGPIVAESMHQTFLTQLQTESLPLAATFAAVCACRFKQNPKGIPKKNPDFEMRAGRTAMIFMTLLLVSEKALT